MLDKVKIQMKFINFSLFSSSRLSSRNPTKNDFIPTLETLATTLLALGSGNSKDYKIRLHNYGTWEIPGNQNFHYPLLEILLNILIN